MPQWRIAAAPRPRIITASWPAARTYPSPTTSTRAAATTAATATPRTSGRSTRCLVSCTLSSMNGPVSSSRDPSGSSTGRNFRYKTRFRTSVRDAYGPRDGDPPYCHLSCHVTESLNVVNAHKACANIVGADVCGWNTVVGDNLL